MIISKTTTTSFPSDGYWTAECATVMGLLWVERFESSEILKVAKQWLSKWWREMLGEGCGRRFLDRWSTLECQERLPPWNIVTSGEAGRAGDCDSALSHVFTCITAQPLRWPSGNLLLSPNSSRCLSTHVQFDPSLIISVTIFFSKGDEINEEDFKALLLLTRELDVFLFCRSSLIACPHFPSMASCEDSKRPPGWDVPGVLIPAGLKSALRSRAQGDPAPRGGGFVAVGAEKRLRLPAVRFKSPVGRFSLRFCRNLAEITSHRV